MMEFESFQKIPRLKRNCTITEKIDGTNAQIHITIAPRADLSILFGGDVFRFVEIPDTDTVYHFRAGSRSRWIAPNVNGEKTDNFGFAAWVYDNADELVKLGEGRHFGEWYGSGIQRNYGLTEKRFALFNTHRWGHPLNTDRPACCDVVPVLHEGAFTDDTVNDAMASLRAFGSKAAPGFSKPEGIVVYHHASKALFKRTLEKDEAPKGEQQ